MTNQTGPFSPWRFAAMLGLLLFAAFPQVALGQHSFFFRDYGVLGYPFVFFHHESFWRGELPLWNPLSNCGSPFLAQWGTMTLYPFSLIYLLFPLPWSLGYFCLAHLFLGGLGMYFLARRWTDNEFGAAFAGVAYVFNGAMFSSMIWPNYLVALGWMPWVVLCTQRAWREGGKQICVAAIVGTLQLLAGVPELVMLTWLLIGALWLAELPAAPLRLQLTGRIATVVALIAALSAIQLLPFLDLLAHSQRTRDFATSKWAMPGWGWANLLVPLFHTYKTFQGQCFQHEQAFMTSYYPGVLVLVLAGWAAWRLRTARVWCLGALVLFSWVMALGENGFLFSWIKRVFPVMGFARFPIKFVLLGAFILPLLGAFALAALGPALKEKRDRSLFVGGAVALLLIGLIVWFARSYPFPLQRWSDLWQNAALRALFLLCGLAACWVAICASQLRWRTLAALSAMGILFADNATHTAQQNPTLPTSWFAAGLWQGRNGPAAGRVFITPHAEQRLLRSTVRDPVHDFIGKRLALWSNLNVVDGVPKVNGSATLQLREQSRLERSLYATNGASVPNGILDFLGVTRITGTNPVDWTIRPSACALVTAGQRPAFTPPEEELPAVLADNFDPRSVVCLPQDLLGKITATNGTLAVVTNILSAAHRLSFEVTARQPAMVVIAQSYYHNWTATVDGKPTPLWRANYAFQALEVPAGRHRVVLRYRDPKLAAGGLVSLLGVAACFALWRRTSRSAHPALP